MIIFSLKFTHYSTIALVYNTRLIFSFEIEKLSANNRFSNLEIFYSDIFLMLSKKWIYINEKIYISSGAITKYMQRRQVLLIMYRNYSGRLWLIAKKDSLRSQN